MNRYNQFALKSPERLHQIDIFAHFSAMHLSQLAKSLKSSSYLSGESIFHEGDSGTSFFLVDSGRVRVRRMTPFGPFDLEKPSPGDLFAEMSFLDGSEREGDAEALDDSVIVTFDPEALAACAKTDPKFDLALQWALWKSLSKKLRAANDRLTRFFTSDSQPENVDREPTARLESEGKFDMANKLGLFREQKLSGMEINFLASLSQEERYEPGQTLFREGEHGEKMYIVAEGTVMISKSIPGVGEEALAFLERGDYFGEMALIEDRPRSADARAHPTSGATVLALPRDVVGGLLNIEKLSSMRLLKILSRLAAKRVRQLHEKLVGWYLLAGGDLESTVD